MTKLHGIDLNVCTFCYNSHMSWGKHLKFNVAKKEAVQICFVCKEYMCQNCVNDSQAELEGHILQRFGFDICYNCVTAIRRDHAMKPRLEQAALEAIEYIKAKIEVKLYTLKLEQHEHRN